MFIRFVGHRIDWSSGRRQGIFHAAGSLAYSRRLTDYDDERLTDIRTWFDVNLKRPTRFTNAKRHHPRPIAICWFRADAKEHLTKAREMQAILDSYDVRIEMITTRRPGYVVYEDDEQVAAIPFRDTTA